MKKTDKKTDNAIRLALTQACDIALAQHEGFLWLTHFINYQQFPKSLSVICVFESNEHLLAADTNALCTTVKDRLASINIELPDISQHVSFDTEENCAIENNGKWRERFELRMNNKFC